MAELIKFTIDNQDCLAEKGLYIVEAAAKNNIYIPTLCNIPGVKPRGACRICSVRVNGKLMSACTTPIADNMKIENNTPEIVEMRKIILETLFVSGNHFCPACERSGSCDLQALAYRFGILNQRFPYQFPSKSIDASHPKIMKDHDRCILCKRCIRGIKTEDGKSFFAYKKRGQTLEISIDTELTSQLTDELAIKAANLCPVGAILLKERGYNIPIGKRQYDLTPIGNEIDHLEK
ncbi:MAG: hypothetical protein A2Y40_01960 [Candidatus Margulisbacteria bacterium GWF2_35_9]|nr:MAG: hypothetical protein A2Y40_01960 [Candidatus Margulisbacteria bacterium GWF2_35_9]